MAVHIHFIRRPNFPPNLYILKFLQFSALDHFYFFFVFLLAIPYSGSLFDETFSLKMI